MYDQDSFFTLAPWGQAGLALLSLSLAALMLCAVRRMGRGWPRAGRLALALVLFWFFDWLSPQVYYLYYLLIIDGLPLQWVIGAPPGPVEIARLLSFTDAGTLSAHGRGALGWAMLAAAFLPLRAHRL